MDRDTGDLAAVPAAEQLDDDGGFGSDASPSDSDESAALASVVADAFLHPGEVVTENLG
jgi:hypothetical protein